MDQDRDRVHPWEAPSLHCGLRPLGKFIHQITTPSMNSPSLCLSAPNSSLLLAILLVCILTYPILHYRICTILSFSPRSLCYVDRFPSSHYEQDANIRYKPNNSHLITRLIGPSPQLPATAPQCRWSVR